ncbi:hypothetical protein DLK05_17450, partial [Ancylomarina longa]
IKTVGCRLSGLIIRWSRATLIGPEFECLERRDGGCALLSSPILGRNGRPLLPGFPWWSSFN